MTYQDEDKEAVCQQFDEVIRSVPAGDKLIILEDFTAQITQHGLELLVSIVSVMSNLPKKWIFKKSITLA